jgi:hypothetical protein
MEGGEISHHYRYEICVLQSRHWYPLYAECYARYELAIWHAAALLALGELLGGSAMSKAIE